MVDTVEDKHLTLAQTLASILKYQCKEVLDFWELIPAELVPSGSDSEIKEALAGVGLPLMPAAGHSVAALDVEGLFTQDSSQQRSDKRTDEAVDASFEESVSFPHHLDTDEDFVSPPTSNKGRRRTKRYASDQADDDDSSQKCDGANENVTNKRKRQRVPK